MQHIHLKFPTTYQPQQLEERVFYLPPPFPLPLSFSRELPFHSPCPLHVEYCSGNGEWILQRALNTPHCNWIAVERRFERCRKIWSKMRNHLLSNLWILCTEAIEVTRCLFPSSSCEALFVNFPDPWPKRRHAKHRLLTPLFFNEVSRVLRPKGKVTIVTDDVPYCHSSLTLLLQQPSLSPQAPPPYYATELPSYGSSYFEQLWREKGKAIYYLPFAKNSCSH